MAYLRRLLVDQKRLKEVTSDNYFLELTQKESRYLNKVLRLRKGDEIFIVDGLGSIWRARIFAKDKLTFLTPFISPEQTIERKKPLICLAVSIPKRGFDEILRMCTEIGVDVFQPLITDRSIAQSTSENRSRRWESILAEASEQSERLWKPELREPIRIESWFTTTTCKIPVALGTTRLDNSIEFELWLTSLPQSISHVWIAIGPEGGWSDCELQLFSNGHSCNVSFGETILTTSTAAVSAAQLITSWRRNK